MRLDLLLVPLLLLAACGRGPATTPLGASTGTSTGARTSIAVRTEGGFHIDYETTRDGATRRRSVHLGAGVGYVYSNGNTFVSVGAEPAGPRQEGLFLGDARVECQGDELFIGDRSYGALDDDAKIELLREGVLVDGERRGDLPARAGDAE